MNAPAPCKPVIRASDEVSVGGILGAAAGMAGGPILGKVAGAVLRGAAGAISKGLGAAGRAIQKAAKSVTRSKPSATKDLAGIPGRVQSRVNVANDPTRFTPLRKSGRPASAGFKHVLKGHFGRALANNRSVFSISASELKLVLQSRTVVNSPVTSLGGGQFSRTVDVGKTIGNASLNQGGAATSRLVVITDRAGNLITTYPVK